MRWDFEKVLYDLHLNKYFLYELIAFSTLDGTIFQNDSHLTARNPRETLELFFGLTVPIKKGLVNFASENLQICPNCPREKKNSEGLYLLPSVIDFSDKSFYGGEKELCSEFYLDLKNIFRGNNWSILNSLL